MIDICDFAVGLSRQLYGLTIATERPGHRMMETWHPLGVVRRDLAFNFPVAVWSWNAALALVCGDPVVWKPSEKTPLTALATQAIAQRALARFGSDAPAGLSGAADRPARHWRGPGGCPRARALGHRLHRAWAAPWARAWQPALHAPSWSWAATTPPSSPRRPIWTWRCAASPLRPWARQASAAPRCAACSCMKRVRPAACRQLIKVYGSVQVGDPLHRRHAGGPADRPHGVRRHAKGAGAKPRAWGHRCTVASASKASGRPDAYYVRPALVELPAHAGPLRCSETFAPILYVVRYSTLDEAIACNNAVGAGLSSSIFTQNLREAEQFMSSRRLGLRHCQRQHRPERRRDRRRVRWREGNRRGPRVRKGSDAWKAYMRRATNTINYSTALPLAQGVKFGLLRSRGGLG
jgi:aldehyde dehydrogenase (NAD+)